MSIKDKDRKARENYRKKVEIIRIELYPTDEDIKLKLKELSKQGVPKTTYIKRIIREDIKRQKE